MRKLILSLPLILLLASCGPADLKKVAQGLDALATATGTAQTTIIEMNKLGQIDTETTRTILNAFMQVNLAQKQAVSITRQLTKLDNPTALQLQQIMQPVAESLKLLISQGVAGIKNEETKQQVLLSITSVQSIVTAITVSLQGG